jgi:glycosyltransferase involved in cell wall biosynthesis
VHRFPVVQPLTAVTRHRMELRIQAGERLSADEQRAWLNSVFRAPELFHHLVAHAGEYGALVFAPYLVWSTAVCSTVAPERTIVMPCLHDEKYAYLDVFQPELTDPAALWFLAEPEHQLAHRLATLPERHVVTGAGVPIPDVDAYHPERFCRRHGIERPFVLYAGRREGGKGWETLLHQLARLAERDALPMDLVTIGAGLVRIPRELDGRVIDLGFVSDDERNDAFAAAVAYLQPSTNESFSRTTMESWLAGTPVVATAAGAVVSWHCERSGGGLVYADEYELAECLAVLAESPETATNLALNGREYVLENYSWSVVLDAMEQALEEMMACVSS